MNETKDVIIIGEGPAGISAALTLINRGKSVLIVSSGIGENPLYKAPVIDNYPGMPKVSGKELLEAMSKQVVDAGAGIVYGRALTAADMGGVFGVSVGADYYACKALIVASGIDQKDSFPGEREYLGRGVSYCATCDGMLYRDKDVAVIGWGEEAENEAVFLKNIGCRVSYYKGKGKRYKIEGGDYVTDLVLPDGTKKDVSAVFILRSKISIGQFMPDIKTADGRIITDEKMRTSVRGVFAAGDCTGKPYQIAKAVGEGNIAALSAAEYLDGTEA